VKLLSRLLRHAYTLKRAGKLQKLSPLYDTTHRRIREFGTRAINATVTIRLPSTFLDAIYTAIWWGIRVPYDQNGATVPWPRRQNTCAANPNGPEEHWRKDASDNIRRERWEKEKRYRTYVAPFSVEDYLFGQSVWPEYGA